MTRILACTSGPEDWKALLAHPDKHWRTGYSAKTLAYCWEEANGFPKEVADVFSKAKVPLLQDLEPVLTSPLALRWTNGGMARRRESKSASPI